MIHITTSGMGSCKETFYSFLNLQSNAKELTILTNQTKALSIWLVFHTQDFGRLVAD
jgi:hypothetical protein